MSEQKKIQCHFISNTHWDREWRFSARRTQHMLVYMVDMLFDILDKNPDFKHFHFDSQTMPLQDYLEVRPEMKEKFKKYVEEGRIAIGPWFNLPDEFTVGGEALIRNLLLGHKMGREFGGISKTGYSPFGWGQISQLPQIYKGFGIQFASFYRGINEYVTPKSEFFWESPDGSRIYASRLGKRPRYNIWYVVQRPVYFNQENENNRNMKWNDNNGVFKLLNNDQELYKLDYQYAHPFFSYNKDEIKPRGEQALREQDNDWTTSHRFWSAGHDSSCPDIREVQMIKDLNDALPNADVFHSTLQDFEQNTINELNPNSPVLYGEMRAPLTFGSVSGMFGWILSARMYIKQDNFMTEQYLVDLAEPMDVFSSFLGAPSQQGFIDLSYNYLLQNHGHDSIGACGRDIVYEDVVDRYRQSRELALCVYERAFMNIAGDINLSAWSRDDAAIVVYNPAPFKRTEVVSVRVELPREWNADTFQILDEDGTPLTFQVIGTDKKNAQIIQNPNDVANVLHTHQYNIQLEARDIPGMGYKAFKMQPLHNVRAKTPITMLKTPQSMENEFLHVSFNANGTFNAKDKVTGREYTNLGFFKDSGEIGNPWEHHVPECNETFTTLNEKADITLLHQGELETVFKVVINWALPESRSFDEKSRSKHLNPCKIVNLVSLKKGAGWVEVNTTVDNQSEDHYLQVGFPTGINAEFSYAQGQFDVLKRQVAKLDYSIYDEIPMTEHPMNSFVDLTDGTHGVALLNTGLKAYEASDDVDNTLYLTLLRCYPLRICVTSDMQDYSQWEKGSQCLGINQFRYAFMPHAGDWEAANVWQASERFNLHLSVAQLAPTAHGKNTTTGTFLELADENLHVSAVKRSESGNGYVIRLFNPSDKTVKNSIRLNNGIAPIEKTQSPLERQAAEFELPVYSNKPWASAGLVSLEEKEVCPLVIKQDGFVDFEITGKKILTIEFK